MEIYMKKILAVITARGGSKRIPRKNIKEFCGKPIIAYSIEAAIKSDMFEEVMVSTDDKEIVEVAKAYGASVPFIRSEKTSDDYATTSDVILEVLERYKEMGKTFDYICCVYPTAPFVTAEKLQKAVKLMEENNPVGIIPVIPFSYPPQRCFVIDENNNMQYKYREYVQARSQDLEKQYHDAGQFYVYHTEKYLASKGKIIDGIMPMILSEMEVQDIDNEEDWKLAELKYRLMKEHNS